MWNFYTQNLEAEKQLKFFQGCVAAAFAESNGGTPPPGYVISGDGPVIGPKQ